MNAVAYIRVSTDDQALGPEAQRAQISAWASKHAVHVVAWYEEIGVSGALPVSKRTTLLAALAALRRLDARTLVAAKRDRLARDVVVAASIERMAAKEGATVRTADGTSDGIGSSGQLQRGIYDLFAAHERAVIRERTTAALAVKRAKGERTGTIPYGYRLAPDGVHLEPHAAELRVIASVTQLRKWGYSLREIVRELAEQGVTGRTGRPMILGQIYAITQRGSP